MMTGSVLAEPFAVRSPAMTQLAVTNFIGA